MTDGTECKEDGPDSSSAQADWFLVVIPRFPRLKEWAYAGVFFSLPGKLLPRTQFLRFNAI